MKYIPILLLVYLAATGCSRDADLIHITNLNGDSISIFGHAGMGAQYKYPIDTWESIGACLAIGADGTEMDIQITKDSVPVVFHHDDLNDGTLCSGMINDKLWSEISGCDHASPYSANVHMQRVQDILSKVDHPRNYTFTFDCKLHSGSPSWPAYLSTYANSIIKVIDDNNMADHVFIESQDTVLLRMFQQRRPGLKLFFYPPSFGQGLATAEFMGLYGITISNDHITRKQAELVHSKNIRITLWGMATDQENFDAIEKNPDYTQSDRIIHLLKIFHQYR
jgi:glycerophosphoryl diester phosphodiesterase